MALTAAQSVARTYITGSTDSYTFQGATNTVAGWYNLGADNAVLAAMNDPAFGAEHSKTAPVAELNGDAILAAVAATGDWSQMAPVMGQFNALVQRVPVTATLFAAIDSTLSTYTAALAAFQPLKTTAATVWQSIVGSASAPNFSQSDLTAIRNEP